MSAAGDELGRLAEDVWVSLMQEEPTWAHLLGRYPTVGRFEDASRAGEDAWIVRLGTFAERAEAIDEAQLDGQQAVTRAVIASFVRTSADLLEARLKEVAADPIFGPQTSLPVLLGMLNLPDAETAGAMTGVLEGIGTHFRDLGDRQREGAGHGRVSAEFAVRGVIEQIETTLALDPHDDPLIAALHPPAEGLDVEDWRDRLVEVVASAVRPGLAAYRDALRDDVLPLARPDHRCGLGWLDDGADAYARTLRYYTTTDRSAEDIHRVGLEQVAQLAEEYRALGPAVVGTDDLAEIFDRMRADPALHTMTAEALVSGAERAMARAEAGSPEWFERLPAARCAVEATTTGAKAYYFPPAPDGTRGGTFFVNVEDPGSWGDFELESLAFHEGVPGHHLQLALASEMGDVPELRRHLVNSAYAEGWGLYSERLADEMGLYSGDVERMGMLSADSMRACRLVVDTGLHAMGWSRQQAVDYMVANSPLTEAICRPEVDRYVVSPGQATSYMIGRLEILRMRREAEQRQGDGFSLPAFHSAVLGSGALPLDVLDRVVAAALPPR